MLENGREQQFQILAASRDPWWMRRARPLCRVPDTERCALSTLQRSRFCRVDKRSASTISLAAGTLLAAATQIWICWVRNPRVEIGFGVSLCYGLG